MNKILVVDDNHDNRMIIAQMLKLSGYDVVMATGGLQALDAAARSIPDLIMLDLAMPGLDGWSTAIQLKAQPHLRHIPLIAVTGHVTSDDIRRALNAGCDDYLPKPIDYEAMLRKVRIYLAA